MLPQCLGESTDGLERGAADMVLYALDVLAHVCGVDTQHFKELSENGVARLDPMRYGSTFVRESQTRGSSRTR